MDNNEYGNIEKAINDYINAQSDDAVFSTGWVIVTEVSDFESSRYVTITSENLKYHALIGLLSLAKRDAETFADAAIIQQLFTEGDDE